MDILHLIGRNTPLFDTDILRHEAELCDKIRSSSFLVIGGAGSIGQAVVKELFKRNPARLFVVDISENNLVELVRDVRSQFGYISGDFQTFALDIDSAEYDAFIRNSGKFDYVLNLSALKHVRSEKDPYTLMRMIQVNIFNTEKTVRQSIENDARKYFCVSTDKAANPVNMMGASKRIMEMYLMRDGAQLPISTARFANVAFSDGSLLHGFNQRLLKRQPIVAPSDVKRYFVTPQESGELCLMSCLFGDNRDIFFPKPSEELQLITFAEIATRFIRSMGYEPYACADEDEARELAKSLPEKKQWPCLFGISDTTGEKDFEEFYTETEAVDFNRFVNLGIVQNSAPADTTLLDHFSHTIRSWKQQGQWARQDLVALFHELLPDFQHKETGKYLDAKM